MWPRTLKSILILIVGLFAFSSFANARQQVPKAKEQITVSSLISVNENGIMHDAFVFENHFIESEHRICLRQCVKTSYIYNLQNTEVNSKIKQHSREFVNKDVGWQMQNIV